MVTRGYVEAIYYKLRNTVQDPVISLNVTDKNHPWAPQTNKATTSDGGAAAATDVFELPRPAQLDND